MGIFSQTFTLPNNKRWCFVLEVLFSNLGVVRRKHLKGGVYAGKLFFSCFILCFSHIQQLCVCPKQFSKLKYLYSNSFYYNYCEINHYNYIAIFELRKPFTESHVFDGSFRISSGNNLASDTSYMSFERFHLGLQTLCVAFCTSL